MPRVAKVFPQYRNPINPGSGLAGYERGVNISPTLIDVSRHTNAWQITGQSLTKQYMTLTIADNNGIPEEL